MTLCSDETNIYLFDSHLHQNHGALVAHCKKASKAEFRNYIGSMLQRNWGASIDGANLIQMELE